MEYTQAYNLKTSDNQAQIIYIGKHCKIKDFFLFCAKDASVSLYITEYFTTKDANKQRRTKTYYLLKDKLVYKNEQYNHFLAHFDAKTKSWTPVSHSPELEFKFPYEFRLIVECTKTNGEVDIICNITNMDKYPGRKIKMISKSI